MSPTPVPAPALALTPTPDTKMSAADWTRRRVLDELASRYEFVYVEAARAVYYRDIRVMDRDIGTADRDISTNAIDEGYSHSVLHKLTDIRANQIIVNICRELYPFKVMAPRTVAELADTIPLYTGRHIDRLNDKIIKVGSDMYWDEEKASFTKQPEGGVCMRELFDASPLDEIKLDINGMMSGYIRSLYKTVLAHLEANDGNIVPWELLSAYKRRARGEDSVLSLESIGIAPFWTWANQDLDTFNDLYKAVASIFMLHKPKGAFILIGRTRNGKSSYIKMLHTMLGRNNTSAVKLADLEDPHFVNDLTTTMLNAPDEDDEGKGRELARSQSYFKSISAHEPIPLKLLFSPEPVKISTQFMSFYPMNKLPEWTGSGKEACMRRSLILMFNNDLSKFDNNGRNFEKDTYTTEFYSEVVAIACGIATYYRDRPLEFSNTMQTNRANISEAIDSATTYLNAFSKYFGSYQVGPLIEDYKLWCNEHGASWDIKDLKQKILTTNTSRFNLYIGGKVISAYRLNSAKNSDLPSFLPQYKVPEFSRCVSDIINTATIGVGPNKQPARSVVAMLEEYYSQGGATSAPDPTPTLEQEQFPGAEMEEILE